MFGSLQLMPSRKEEDLTSVYGWMVAANPIGQMIFSPILGYVTAKRGGRIRMIGVGCAVTFIVGSKGVARVVQPLWLVIAGGGVF